MRVAAPVRPSATSELTAAAASAGAEITALDVIESTHQSLVVGITCIVVSGAGAAGHAVIRLPHAQGATHIVACDRSGALHRDASYADEHRQWIADHTNPAGQAGRLDDVLAGGDVFAGVSRHNILGAQQIATMAGGAVVLALANPDPEIHPVEAAKHATVVATGRSNLPNQINNVLAFPSLFRGLLDAAARDIDTPMSSLTQPERNLP